MGCEPDKMLSILLIDDEPVIHLLLGEDLRGAGYFVGDANDGVEGLWMFKEGSWDLVITDRAMPRMGGEQLAEEIKKVSADVPLILITGFVKSDTRCELFDEVLEKAFTRADLPAAVERVRNGKHVAAERC